MARPKLLIALFRLPYPATDGTRYKILYNVAEGLKSQYDIEFFVVNIKPFHPDDVTYLETHFGKVHLFHHSKIAYLLNAFPALSTGLPLQAQAFHFADAQRWLDAHIHEFAAVYIHEIRMTEFFINYSLEQKQKFLVDFNDAISMNYAGGVTKMNVAKKLFYSWEGGRVARYESQVLKNFHHFSVVSEVDKQYLLKQAGLGDTHIDFSVINHGAPVSKNAALRDMEQIFFMGSLDYEPNRDALTFFLETIWESVLASNPHVELLVLGGGRIPDSLKQYPRVRFTGFVPSVFETVTHCKALVAPIRFAGGTPSKIIEAMGYGIPVITTPSGAAGISGVVADSNIIIVPESDTNAWVESINRLLTDQVVNDRIGAQARLLVLEHYSAQAAQERIRNRFNKLLGM